MYKILILKRASTTDSLWVTYKTMNEYESHGNLIDYETDDINDLANTINALLDKYPKEYIFPIKNMSYIIDVAISDDI